MEYARCASCKEEVVPVPPKTAWKVVSFVFWIGLLAAGTLFGCLLGLNVVLVPFWIAMAGAVGVTASRASAWTCPECHSEMAPAPELVREERARRTPRARGLGHGPFVPQHA